MICKIQNNDPQSDLLFVFFAGFGSDHKYWCDVQHYFADYNAVFLSENYFNDPADVAFDDLADIFKNKTIVGVGHSLGYYKLCALQEQYSFFQMQKIVSVEGFSSYLGHNCYDRTVREFYLNLMKINYQIAPKQTLSNFISMCGFFMPALPALLNQDQILRDIDLLYKSIACPKIPHLVLSSFDDWVVPYSIIEDNFRRLKDVNIIYTFGAGHLLGMRYPKQVSEQILQFTKLK